jgi:hypothetical protein
MKANMYTTYNYKLSKNPLNNFFRNNNFKQKNTSALNLNFQKKYLLWILISSLYTGILCSQTLVYDDFEGNKSLAYGERNGVLDTVAKNPEIDSVNKSKTCALYIRNGSKKFDNIKMRLPAKLADVSTFATPLILEFLPKLK